MSKKGMSLHIGVNSVNPDHYGGWAGPLNACEADAEDMMSLAVNGDFDSQILLTGEATRQAVIGAIKQAAEKLSDGDIFLVTYSGHGGQVADVNGDEQDLRDETWCLYDGQLIDDELANFWSLFQRGVRIFVLSDSCHSGSVSRAPVARADPQLRLSAPLAEILGTDEVRTRCMPDEHAARTYRTNKKFYDDIQRALPKKLPEVDASVRLISGCQDNQLSLDGTFNGLFTGQLLRVWSSGNFSGNYSEFHKAIVLRMPPSQTPNHFVTGAANLAYDEQKPFQI